MSVTQLIAFTSSTTSSFGGNNSPIYYGELVDDRILRGSRRMLYTSNTKIIPITPEWVAYLNNRVLEFEQPENKWFRMQFFSGAGQRLLQHESGYVMPLITVASQHILQHFHCIYDAPMPTQTIPPPPIVSAAF